MKHAWFEAPGDGWMSDLLAESRLFELLDAHAPWRPVGPVPTLSAWQADSELPLWQALEAAVGRRLPPPFFCVPWPAAQALAVAIVQGVIDVRGQRVAEVGAGSGLVSAAAMHAGAESALALDLDPLAGPAAGELARRNGTTIAWRTTDALADPSAVGDAGVIVGADLVYEADQRAALRSAVASWRRRSRVILADGGRPFFDPCGLPTLVEYEIPVSPGVEGVATRIVRVHATHGPTPPPWSG